jgi:hypothetical protein
MAWQTQSNLAAVAQGLAFNLLEIVGYSWGGLLAMLYSIVARGAVPGSVPVPSVSGGCVP